MYSRAEKGTFLTFVDTPGPGAYTLPSDRDYREENVPFRFKVGHTPVWEPKPGPAPNAYTIKYRKHRIKGAAWSKMTEKKPFAKYQNGNDDIDESDQYRTAEEAHRMKFYEPKQDKPKLCRGRPKDCYPCGEDESKTIKELDIRKFYKKTYKDNMKKCKGCEKYRGPAWSKYKAKRFSTNDEIWGPSPNDYDVEGFQNWKWVEGPINEKEWYEDIRFYKRATAKIQRFTDMVECEQAKNDEPSPADTAYSSDFWKKKSFNVKGTFGNPPLKLPPVQVSGKKGSTLPRTIDLQNDQPVSKKARKRPPFNVTATRGEKIPETPGPADYNPPQGTVQFDLCKKLPPSSATYVAPFGTTAVQRPLMVDQGIPDPGTYDTRVKPGRVPYGAKITTFTSRRDRTKSKTNNQISPAYYDTVAVYDRLKNGCDPCKKRKPFNSSAPRLVSQTIDMDIPGPAAYAVKDDALRTGGRAGTNMGKPPEKRTVDVSSATPGPGQYDIHPLYKDSVVKAHCTHNVTLVPYPNFYPIKPKYGPPLPKVILKTFVKGSKRF